MSRRVSSRDDVFLSATDMYTLLSFVFIGFALVQNRAGGPDLAAIELPHAREGTAATPQQTTLRVAWEPISRGKVQDSTGCSVIVNQVPSDLRNDLEPGKATPIPCWPYAFDGTRSEEDAAARRRWHSAAQRLENPNVLLECPVNPGDPAQALLDCARLQWILSDAGFRPLVLVPRRVSGGPSP